MAEKLITLAKQGTLNARRAVIATLQDRRVTDEDQEFVVDEKGREMTVIRRLFDEVAPQFTDRNGGVHADHQDERVPHRRRWRVGRPQLVTTGPARRGTSAAPPLRPQRNGSGRRSRPRSCQAAK
jgi:hypothetical protein